jgi:hypothetical protein
MRTFPTAAMLLAVSPAVMTAQTPLRVDSLRLDEPVTVTEFDIDDLKGQPSRLAWSADGSQLYLQTLEGGFGRPDVKLRHYVFAATNGARQNLQIEPEWASEYWIVKSGQASPDGAHMKIELKSEQRRERTTSVPMGGDLARGGTTTATGTATNDGINAAYNSQSVPVHSMFFNGQLVGEFVNSVIVPGLTFGWGPKGTQTLAFAAPKSGRVVVMDAQGGRKELAGSKDALLPAWSPDASRLAWLQKDGRKKFLLKVSRVNS